jgi:mono/diheme cytochrome c family protein
MMRDIRLTALAAVAAALALSVACGGSSANPASPSTTTTTTTPDPLVITGALAYDPDLKAVFNSDCVRCHGSSGASAGYSLTTYAGVMTAVRPGDAQSRLVTITQSGGAMNRYLSGNSAGRADMIKRWVVTYNAAATR